MTTIEQQLSAAPRRLSYILTITIILLGLFVWSASTFNMQTMNASSLSIGWNIISGLLTPNLDLLFNLNSNGVIYLLLETMAIAFLGTIIGSIVAVPLAFLSASNVVPLPIASVTRLLLIVIRTIPALVYGLMFIRVTGPGPFAGVLTIALASIGMLSKLYVDAIENLDTRVLESMSSLGCTTFEKIRYGIIPQLFAIFLSIMIYRFDMNLRDASILGLVGAGGIGAPLLFAMNAHRWSEAGALLCGLVLLILLVEMFSNYTRTRLVRG